MQPAVHILFHNPDLVLRCCKGRLLDLTQTSKAVRQAVHRTVLPLLKDFRVIVRERDAEGDGAATTKRPGCVCGANRAAFKDFIRTPPHEYDERCVLCNFFPLIENTMANCGGLNLVMR
jgi:hypothetical protein